MHQIKKFNLFLYLAIFLIFSFGGRILNLITDYYWFSEIGSRSLYIKMLLTQGGLGISAAFFVVIILFLNLQISLKLSKKPFIIIEPDATVHSPLPIPQFSFIKPIIQIILISLILLAALFTGIWASNHWETVLKFVHRVPFNSVDPLFGRDIGFYVFTLPFYRFIYHLILTSLIFSLLISLFVYALNSRILFSEKGVKIADNSKAHIVILLSMMSLLFAYHFQLKIFDLLSAQRTLSPGAGYSFVKAYLPGLKVLRFIAVGSAILLWGSLWVSWRLSSTKIVITAIVLLIGGTILARAYAEIVQKFEVGPNEIVKETPYIKFAIENTRQAYGLTKIQELEFDPQENLSPSLLKKNDLTVKNIRLWEHVPLLTSYGQLQEIRTYYDFLDADNDRYFINGEYRQVMVSVRELVPESLPSRIWINEHLTYTHGYGICMGPVNRISPEGLPEFFIKDIPPVSGIDLQVKKPQVYFGESRTNYAIIKTHSKEFDYPAGEENVYTSYNGSGGISVKNFFRKLIFALRFSEFKILFSKDITSESRFLLYRSIKERVNHAFPFLKFDNDPYIIISDEGKLFWMIDGYTLTDRYPYSQKIGGVNYIRNSVKATIDAYNGTMTLYISDAQDPLIQTYSKIFPHTFKLIEEMPEDLRSHIRYPQTLMNIQAKIYATYHMTDPQVFYNQEDLWKIPLRTAGGRNDPMEPYYTIMKLAEIGEKEEFILMVPFTPAKKENMIAWMAARCDEPDYGKLLVYNFPKQKLVYGPQQIESRIDQEAEISKQLTLWDQGGSRVLRGNLLVIPVEQSLLYVQPLYLEASGGGLPELKRIIVAYGNSIVMEENLESALMKIFEGKIDRSLRESSAPADAKQEIKMLIRQAKEHYEKSQNALRQGNWAVYGQEMKLLEKFLNNLASH